MALLLDPLFSPNSVAVIGASANQDRTGYKFTHELLMRLSRKGDSPSIRKAARWTDALCTRAWRKLASLRTWR